MHSHDRYSNEEIYELINMVRDKLQNHAAGMFDLLYILLAIALMMWNREMDRMNGHRSEF